MDFELEFGIVCFPRKAHVKVQIKCPIFLSMFSHVLQNMETLFCDIARVVVKSAAFTSLLFLYV